jgi:hypothetical protein
VRYCQRKTNIPHHTSDAGLARAIALADACFESTDFTERRDAENVWILFVKSKNQASLKTTQTASLDSKSQEIDSDL